MYHVSFYFIDNSYKVKSKDAQLAVMHFAVNGTARARRMRFCAFFVQYVKYNKRMWKFENSKEGRKRASLCI